MKAQIKKISMLMIAAAMLTSTCFAQAGATETAAPKKGLWEKFCLEQNILDACSKASSSLKKQIQSDLSDEQRTNLQARLNEITQKSCSLKGHKGCPQVSKSDASKPGARIPNAV